MATYTYADCLTRPIGWAGRSRRWLGFVDFDPDRPWLPTPLSGASGLTCLDAGEKLRMTHVEMGSYAQLFGFGGSLHRPRDGEPGQRMRHGPPRRLRGPHQLRLGGDQAHAPVQGDPAPGGRAAGLSPCGSWRGRRRWPRRCWAAGRGRCCSSPRPSNGSPRTTTPAP